MVQVVAFAGRLPAMVAAIVATLVAAAILTTIGSLTHAVRSFNAVTEVVILRRVAAVIVATVARRIGGSLVGGTAFISSNIALTDVASNSSMSVGVAFALAFAFRLAFTPTFTFALALALGAVRSLVPIFWGCCYGHHPFSY
jgi:predicted membrane protein